MTTQRPFALLGLVAVLSCYSYQPVSTAPTPGASVRIVMVSATQVPVLDSGRGGARSAIDGVLEAAGVVQAASADTIALRLGDLRTAAGPVAGLANRIALLPVARVSRVYEQRFQAGRSALTGIGLLTLAGSAFLVLLIVTITKAAR